MNTFANFLHEYQIARGITFIFLTNKNTAICYDSLFLCYFNNGNIWNFQKIKLWADFAFFCVQGGIFKEKFCLRLGNVLE